MLLAGFAGALAFLCGCAGGASTPTEGFKRGRFSEFAKIEPVPKSRLVEVSLVQVAWIEERDGVRTGTLDRNSEGEEAEREDLGFIRVNEILVPLRPWDERPEDGFVLRAEGSFPAPIKDDKGREEIYECVWREVRLITDTKGTPLGRLDDDGTVFLLMPNDYGKVNRGAGTPYEAAKIVWDLKPRFSWNPEVGAIVARKPRVIITPMDAYNLNRRIDAKATASQDPAFKPDPLYNDRDRVWNK